MGGVALAAMGAPVRLSSLPPPTPLPFLLLPWLTLRFSGVLGRHWRDGRNHSWSLLIPSLNPQPQITPGAAPTSFRCLFQRTRTYLREGLRLVQHGLGGGLEGLGRFGDPALSGRDCLLKDLRLQGQAPSLGLPRLQGDAGLRQGAAGRSAGQVVDGHRCPGMDGGERGL